MRLSSAVVCFVALAAGCARRRPGCPNTSCAPEPAQRPSLEACQRLAASLGDGFPAGVSHGDPLALCRRSTTAILACEAESALRCQASTWPRCRQVALARCMVTRRAEAAIAQGFVDHVTDPALGGLRGEDNFVVLRLPPALQDVGLEGKVWRADRGRGWLFIPLVAGHCYEHVSGFLCAARGASAPAPSQEGGRRFFSLAAPGLSGSCLIAPPLPGARERYEVVERRGRCWLVEAEH